jgi:hypothetical protein
MQGYEPEMDALEAADTETWEEPGEAESVFDEADEMELAGALLEVTDEDELDQFLGSVIRRAGRAVGGIVRSPVGQQLGGILKGAVRQALPVVGTAIGSAIGGRSGGQLGGRLASTAGRLFGLELEGLSDEDQMYEVARRLVRLAGAAAASAAQAVPTTPPVRAARAAAMAAARRHAPGLLRPGSAPIAGAGSSRQGRWMRRGRTIIVVNGAGAGSMA